jgi:glycosyltransferase involved in cell wall biosynthesis
MAEAYCNLTQLLNNDIRLVIAGPIGSTADKNSLEQILARKGLLDRVTFTGFIGKSELANLYRQAELLIFPSLVETFGLPLIEAMASGLPVVSSNATAMPEICQEAALYFDPLNISEMTQSMQRVLTEVDLRDELIYQGLKRASNFSWESTARSLLCNLEMAKNRT